MEQQDSNQKPTPLMSITVKQYRELLEPIHHLRSLSTIAVADVSRIIGALSAIMTNVNEKKLEIDWMYVIIFVETMMDKETASEWEPLIAKCDPTIAGLIGFLSKRIQKILPREKRKVFRDRERNSRSKRRPANESIDEREMSPRKRAPLMHSTYLGPLYDKMN